MDERTKYLKGSGPLTKEEQDEKDFEEAWSNKYPLYKSISPKMWTDNSRIKELEEGIEKHKWSIRLESCEKRDEELYNTEVKFYRMGFLEGRRTLREKRGGMRESDEPSDNYDDYERGSGSTCVILNISSSSRRKGGEGK